MHFEYDIQGGDFSRAGIASSQVKKTLKQLVADHKTIKRVVVALYEAEVNVVAHAYHGVVKVDIDTNEIVMRVVDEGPGIEDIEIAMQEGYSTASEAVREMGFGAGMGLSNIRNNSDIFEIKSEVNRGTEVLIRSKLNNQ